jgi:hypothetical protein
MTRRETDRMSSLVCLGVAIAICMRSISLSLGDPHKPGPGFFSFLTGASFGLLSFVVFLRSFQGSGGREREVLWPNPQRKWKVMYVLIALTIYSVGMDYLGFFLSTLLLLGFLLRGIDPQRWSVVLAGAILGAILFYGIFQWWLGVQLPSGIFGY